MDGRTRGDNSRSRHSIWCSAHWNMPASTHEQRKIVWADGNTAIDRALDGPHPYRASGRASPPDRNSPAGLARKLAAPESYSERQLEELRPALSGPWLDDYERTSRAAREGSRELRHSPGHVIHQQSPYFEINASGCGGRRQAPPRLQPGQRPADCPQVVIALVVTPEGLPLAPQGVNSRAAPLDLQNAADCFLDKIERQ